MQIRFENDDYEGIKVENVPFNNLKGYKIFSRFIATYKEIINLKNATFVIYSLNISFLLAVYCNKILNKSNRVVLIIPDLPEFMNSENTFLKKCMLKIQDFVVRKLIFSKIDCFVLLTEQMAVRLRLDKSKVQVIEGIYSDDIIQKHLIKEDKFRILYTGTLAKRYGILDLLSQFSIIEDENMELLICGAGDGVDEVMTFLNNDKRIKYLGQLPRAEILNLQRTCSLLVNPRKPEEFTKYSFPSKTMEYFASGTPVLMYKLQGIPTEYFDYCFTLDESNINSLSIQICKIKNIPLEIRASLGLEAQKFILNKKNPKQQLLKIKYLLDGNH